MKLQYKLQDIVLISLVTIFLASYSKGTFADSAVDDKGVLISEGEFNMGCSVGDSDCGTDEGAQGGVPIMVPNFFIDSYEVTVSEYESVLV